MTNVRVPENIQEETLRTIKHFNEEHQAFYTLQFKRSFAYLDRIDNNGKTTHIARLKYDQDDDHWDFAPFRYSSEKYDPNEMAFPGAEMLDGSILGALQAGQEMYPDTSTPDMKINLKGCLLGLAFLPSGILAYFIELIFKIFSRRKK